MEMTMKNEWNEIMALTRERDALWRFLRGDTWAVKGFTCEKVLHQRTLHVWRKHILENQSGTNLGLCGNVAPAICVPALQSVSLARSRSPPPPQAPHLCSHPPHGGSDAWSRSPTKSHGNGLRCLCWVSAASLPLVPQPGYTYPSLGQARWSPLPIFSPSFFFPSLFCRSSPLCTVRYVRCGSTVPEKTHTTACAHTHTYAHTHAVTDTQLGPSCTQRQGFGNQWRRKKKRGKEFK